MPVMVFGGAQAVEGGEAEADIVFAESVALNDVVAQRTRFADSLALADRHERSHLRLADSIGLPDQLAGTDVDLFDSLGLDDALAPRIATVDSLALDDQVGSIKPAFTDSLGIDDALIVDAESRIAESVALDERIAPSLIVADSLGVDDLIRPRIQVADSIGFGDNPQSRNRFTDSLGLGDTFSRIEVLDVTPVATGATNTFYGDAYTDHASPNTNFGSPAANLARFDTPVTDNGQIVWAKLNFTTAFENLSAIAGDDTLTIQWTMSHDGAAGTVTLVARWSFPTADPFTENTITWNNQPAQPGGGTSNLSITTTPTFNGITVPLSSVLGKWLLVRFAVESSLFTSVVTVRGRENATTTPKFRFNAKR